MIKNDENPIRNSEGYLDLTAHDAIKKADADLELARLRKLLSSIFNICDLAGYSVEERIVLKDKATGKIWR